MKRRHELICREEFEAIVARTYPRAHLTWNEPEQDPPDWYLRIDNARFAVEATSITEELKLAGNAIPSPSASMALAEFIDNVEQAAKDLGVLSGAYLVSLCPIPNLQQHRDGLQSHFLQYISETRDVASAPERGLGFIGNHELTITKLHDDATYVAEAISFETKSGQEAQEELQRYLSAVLATKKHKLRNVAEPLILPILDAYHYSHIADWKLAVANISERSAFRCIARISPPNGSEVIWPGADWLKG